MGCETGRGVEFVFLGCVALAGFDGGPCVTSWWVGGWCASRNTAEQVDEMDSW